MALFGLGLSCSLSLTLRFDPGTIALSYIPPFLFFFILIYLINWIYNDRHKQKGQDSNLRYSLSKSFIWMNFFSSLVGAISALITVILYWLFSEYVTVTIIPGTSVSIIWIIIGTVIGAIYGFFRKTFLQLEMRPFITILFFSLSYIFFCEFLNLTLVNYPIDRLSPLKYPLHSLSRISYQGLSIFGFMLIFYFFLKRISCGSSYLRTTLSAFFWTLCMVLHVLVLAQHSTALYITYASVLESQGNFTDAKNMYAQAIPYLRNDEFNASLLHRQGVLEVLDSRPNHALKIFKQVVAEHTEFEDDFQKSKDYIKAYKQQKSKPKESQILKLKYRTFQQAASCFPNSLALVLNYFQKAPISTRELSYLIKEGFHQGTFIWKAQSYLEKKDYQLFTSYWHDSQTVMNLIDHGFPVLIYVPQHVYAVYGYDRQFKIFFSYDTAKQNRWDDKPFKSFMEEWMKSSFLMSVVVPKIRVPELMRLAPNVFLRSDFYNQMQKLDLSQYYSQKDNFWIDFDKYREAPKAGLAAIILDSLPLSREINKDISWEPDVWAEQIKPLFQNSWARHWRVAQKTSLFLASKGQNQEAYDLIKRFERNLKEESEPLTADLFLIKLALAKRVDDEDSATELELQLIGEAEKEDWDSSYWGHVQRARRLQSRGETRALIGLLSPIVQKISPNRYDHKKSFYEILNILKQVCCAEPKSITDENLLFQLKISWIGYGIPLGCTTEVDRL